MASAAALPSLLSGLQRPRIKSSVLIPCQVRKNPYPNPNFSPKRSSIAAAAAASTDPSPSSWEREEIRWVREEHRWLREERRWVREESRWRSQSESLIREIAALRLKIEALERERPVDAPIGRISEVGALPALAEEAEVKEMIFEEVVRVSDEKIVDEKEKRKEERKTLRKGSEGEEVRVMQEALLKLGFFSGEDDMEFSSFSSETERAVKIWQASVGTLQDGIMTSDLLERLFMEISSNGYTNHGEDSVSSTVKDGTNGTPSPSVSQTMEIKEKFIKATGDVEVEVSAHRVFLLGENRWEEPSRLTGRDKPNGGSKVSSPTMCLTCRGEGRLLCIECDGSGEPNIEPQFMEWVDEGGAKCPYCKGLGFTTCDECECNAVASI